MKLSLYYWLCDCQQQIQHSTMQCRLRLLPGDTAHHEQAFIVGSPSLVTAGCLCLDASCITAECGGAVINPSALPVYT
jgi:hypothetical protein